MLCHHIASPICHSAVVSAFHSALATQACEAGCRQIGAAAVNVKPADALLVSTAAGTLWIFFFLKKQEGLSSSDEENVIFFWKCFQPADTSLSPSHLPRQTMAIQVFHYPKLIGALSALPTVLLEANWCTESGSLPRKKNTLANHGAESPTVPCFSFEWCYWTFRAPRTQRTRFSFLM